MDIRYFHLSACARKSEKSRNTFKVKFWLFLWESLYVSVYMDIKYFSPIGLCEKVWFKSLSQTGWNIWFVDTFSIITGTEIWLFLCEMSLNVCICMDIKYFHLSTCARNSRKILKYISGEMLTFSMWNEFIRISLYGYKVYVSVYMDIKYFSPIGFCEEI